MSEILNHLISQLNSSVFTLIGILFVAFWGVAKLSGLSGRLVERFGHHESKLKTLEGLNDKVVAISTKIDLIYQNTNPHALVRAHSPISITDSGKEISVKIDADAIFSKYSSRLIQFAEEENPKNAYDIQTESMKVSKDKLIPLLDANEINTIKNTAFSKGLIVEDIMGIFGVLLRDKILEIKGIPVAEVDTHATS